MTAAFDATDSRFMARALQLAERGRFTTDPNPRVGCVLVRDGVVVGEGWHRRAGEPHAEREALAIAGDAARGATAYVTLEPCSHHGRTPPCADALVEAQVSRVVAAVEDPNPLVAGSGLARLQAAGIETACGLMQDAAIALNRGFFRRMRSNRPWVRCKLAMSLDGHTAMRSGESQWITGDAARADVQRMRAASSAIMTGIGTVLADDPSMNVRLAAADLAGMAPEDPVRQPTRVVLDTRLRMPPRARMLTLPGETWVVCGEAASEEARSALAAAGAEVIRLPQRGDRLDLALVIEALAARGINELMVESGPTLAGGLVQAGLVDELVVYMAPHLMGHTGRELLHLPGIDTMRQRLALRLRDCRRIGDDLRLAYQPQATAE